MPSPIIAHHPSELTPDRHSEQLPSTFQGWWVVIIASLFFFYEFIQMNMFNAISQELMTAFSVNASELGILSSFYFMANVIFLFPAGFLLDRFSTKWIILITLAICMAGIFLLSFAHSFWIAVIARFLSGIGSAFCFLSVIRLSSRWFPPHRMALMTGVIITIAMLGGVVAQTPMTLLTQAIEWRQALVWDAALGVVIWIIIFLFVQDYPEGEAHYHDAEVQSLESIGYWKSLGLAFLQFKNWLAGIYTSLVNLPLSLLGGLWGMLYLTDAHGLDKIRASEITSMLFIGMLIGSPLVGWISDHFRLRKLPMLLGALALLFVMIWVIYNHVASYPLLWLSFLLIGLLSSTQIISYPYVAESSPRMITAMSVSTVNITTQAGQGLFQPLFGFLIDWHTHDVHHGAVIYSASDFHWAMWLFPIGLIVALMAAFALHETHCQQIE
ncbi:MAG TPA: MFS transporter [Coxiellaceae bacterium]|nr:MFS transporter [Coxiellaceae bacterium]